MGYLIISLFVLAILGYIFWNPKLAKFRVKHEAFLNFLLTFAATFVGVFLALYLTNVDEKRIEKEKTVELLYKSSEDIYDNARALTILFTDFVGDKEDYQYDYYEYIQRNPRTLPEAHFSILENDMVIRTISVDGFSELTESKRTMLKIINLMNNTKLDDELIKTYIDVYGRELAYSQQIITIEIALLQNKINETQAEKLRGDYELEKVGITLEDIENLVIATPTLKP